MTYDSILVLGSGVSEDGTLNERAIRRVEKGVELLKQNVSSKIIFSGKFSYTLKIIPAKTEAEAMKDYALTLGVEDSSIIIEENAVTTLANFYYVKNKILIPNGWFSIVAVTEFPHVERVKYNAEYMLGEKYTIDVVASDFVYEPSDVELEKNKMPKVITFFSKYTKGDDKTMFADAEEEVRQYLENNKAIY